MTAKRGSMLCSSMRAASSVRLKYLLQLHAAVPVLAVQAYRRQG